MDTTTRTLERPASEDISAEEKIHEKCTEDVCRLDAAEQTTADEIRDEVGTIYVPAVDLIEGERQVMIVADVPGVTEGGVELTVEKSVLTLAAKPEPILFEGKKLAYSEYGVGEYRCSFTLSDEIDKENISASLKDGVLTVVLPKQAPVTKKIAVAIA